MSGSGGTANAEKPSRASSARRFAPKAGVTTAAGIKPGRSAAQTGIREAGIDARFSEIGAAIQETIESYEIELDGARCHKVHL